MKLINGQNYFNEESFNEMCEALETGEIIEVYIDCIGHTRDMNEKAAYQRALKKKYGEYLTIHVDGKYSLSHP